MRFSAGIGDKFTRTGNSHAGGAGAFAMTDRPVSWRTHSCVPRRHSCRRRPRVSPRFVRLRAQSVAPKGRDPKTNVPVQSGVRFRRKTDGRSCAAHQHPILCCSDREEEGTERQSAAGGACFPGKNDETNPTLTANSFICHKTSESNHPDQTQIESVGVAGDHARQPVVPHARK